MTADDGDLGAFKRAVNSIPRVELVKLCEEEFGRSTPSGDLWKDQRKPDLVDSLVTNLPSTRLRELAADGAARVRAPGFHGFIWHLHTSAEKIASPLGTLDRITEDHLAGELKNPVVSAVDAGHSSSGASVFAELRYTTEDWQVTPSGQAQLFEKHRTANIALDLLTGVLTVFASNAATAGIIASGVADLFEVTIAPLTLNQVEVPSVDGASFAPSALQVLEVVYGRFAESYDILHAPTIWIRPTAAGAVARERASRGEGADMFDDGVVRTELRAGAEIRGIRFYLRERPPSGDPAAPVATLAATIKADDDLGISLQLARGSYSTDRVMRIYEDLRSRMMHPAPSSGVALTAKLQVISGK